MVSKKKRVTKKSGMKRQSTKKTVKTVKPTSQSKKSSKMRLTADMLRKNVGDLEKKLQKYVNSHPGMSDAELSIYINRVWQEYFKGRLPPPIIESYIASIKKRRNSNRKNTQKGGQHQFHSMVQANPFNDYSYVNNILPFNQNAGSDPLPENTHAALATACENGANGTNMSVTQPQKSVISLQQDSKMVSKRRNTKRIRRGIRKSSKSKKTQRRQRRQKRRQHGGNMLSGIFSQIGNSFNNVMHGISNVEFPPSTGPIQTAADRPAYQTESIATPEIHTRIAVPLPEGTSSSQQSQQQQHIIHIIFSIDYLSHNS